MKVVWSDEAVFALIALEMKLAERYSAERAADIVEALVRRLEHLEQHAQLGRAVPEYGHPQLRELFDSFDIARQRSRSRVVRTCTGVRGRRQATAGPSRSQYRHMPKTSTVQIASQPGM